MADWLANLEHGFLSAGARLSVVVAMGVSLMTAAQTASPRFFDLVDNGPAPADVEKQAPWRTIALDPEYGGLWVVAGDVDGDGEVEIVSAENHNQGDVHYTSTAVAQKLDGTVLWRWGDPAIGRKAWHHDVACQIHDWDGDGHNEVIVCAEKAIVVLDGKTGKELQRIPIQKGATDCLVFCDLRGTGHKADVLVKDRYQQIWAYSNKGDLLWTSKKPGGSATAHQPRPMDIDGDGKDEIMAGYAMLNADGSVRWTASAPGGHLDCARLVRMGAKPDDLAIAITCCSGNAVALLNRAGKNIWQIKGQHYESLDVGRVFPSIPGPQFVVDIDHQPKGKSPIVVLDSKGALLARITTGYSRHHCLIDWDGDGADEILVGGNQAIYHHSGKRLATLAAPEAAGGKRFEASILPADMTGNGIPDALLCSPSHVHIFRNPSARKLTPPHPLGTVPNMTLY